LHWGLEFKAHRRGGVRRWEEALYLLYLHLHYDAPYGAHYSALTFRGGVRRRRWRRTVELQVDVELFQDPGGEEVRGTLNCFQVHRR
jgi:hypothetical protein